MLIYLFSIGFAIMLCLPLLIVFLIFILTFLLLLMIFMFIFRFLSITFSGWKIICSFIAIRLYLAVSCLLILSSLASSCLWLIPISIPCLCASGRFTRISSTTAVSPSQCPPLTPPISSRNHQLYSQISQSFDSSRSATQFSCQAWTQ